MLRRIGRLCCLVQTFAVRLACLRQASRAAAAPPDGSGAQNQWKMRQNIEIFGIFHDSSNKKSPAKRCDFRNTSLTLSDKFIQ